MQINPAVMSDLALTRDTRSSIEIMYVSSASFGMYNTSTGL